MAEGKRSGLNPRQLDIQQILLEAQHRWLRPAEICEILQNYKKFRIAPEPPNMPPSGSLFLFDRKVLRYFRKDGHNWRKKKDGKTVKEAHERLKSGSIDVLHCYYAHGEDNSNFQRRAYWMLEEEFLHIVLVHYREVKNKESYARPRDLSENTQTIVIECPSTSNSSETCNIRMWQPANAESPNSIRTSDCEDSGTDFQASSRYNPLAELLGFNGKTLMDADHINSLFQVQPQHIQDTTNINNETGSGLIINGSAQAGLTSWDEVLEHYKASEDSSFPTTFSSSVVFEMEGISRSVNMPPYENVSTALDEADLQNNDQELDSYVMTNFSVKNDPEKDEKAKYHLLLKQLSLDFPNIEGEKCLQKHDSFSRWMSKELGEVNETPTHVPSTFGMYWDAVERESIVNDSTLDSEDQKDTYLLNPSLSQYQLFSINDFSPNWAYSGTSSKILISGAFLLDKKDIDIYNWSCMFGEVEVPAEVLADDLLQCHAPPRKSGIVPFYITCSNRLACSEVRDFQYRDENAKCLDTSEPYSGKSLQISLHLHFEKFLSEVFPDNAISSNWIHISNKINSLLMGSDDGVSKKMLKEKLHAWLLHKVAEDGKGPNILDKEGHGVIHLAAALGYDWAIAPTIVAGVNVNFRDKHGWTALHWAAFCGREHTVVTLLSLRASPGALTDPTSEFPSGRTPADLAAKSGHKGIAGFLAQSSLTSHLSYLTLQQPGENSFSEIYDFPNNEDTAERYSRICAGDSLKDSLSAVCSATQAAARIHQVFRVQSFHRKEKVKYVDDKFGISNERVISLLSLKTNKAAAAVRIQNKFRGWKGRKEFLIIRQRIVKIQAHVRGHQVRKHLRKIVWTVGIVEKIILRWRRKGSGLRGFRSEGLIKGPATQLMSATEDDSSVLQDGRKQTEARLERALGRVKSMVQYPEARDQYRRLLTNVEEFQESKVVLERILNDSEETTETKMLLDIDELLLEDDSLTPASSCNVGSSMR